MRSLLTLNCAYLHSSTSDLKNTSDDHIPKVLESLGYTQDNHLEYIRLAIGYSSVIVAAITAYYDYIVGFEKSFHIIATCVALLFLIDVGL